MLKGLGVQTGGKSRGVRVYLVAELEVELPGARNSSQSQQQLLIFQRDHIFFALAESRDALESAFRLRQEPDWAKAVNGVAVFREVPLASLAGGALGSAAIDGRLGRWNAVRAVQRS